MTNSVVSVFGVEPFRIGAGEIFARELSRQLGELGWSSVLCFLKQPPDSVRRFIELPNVSFEVLEDSWKLGWKPARGLARILKKHRPRILHLHFTGFLGPYPWLATWHGVEQVFFTDHTSRPAFHVPRRAAVWKRVATRIVNAPITKVVCVSDYGYRCFTATDLLPRERFERIYDSIDVSRAAEGLERGPEFRRKHGIPPDRLVVVQVCWMIPEKGVPDLLEAARLTLARNPHLHFLLAGEGSARREYMRLAEEMGIADHVTFTGVVEDPLGEGLYAAAGIACQVSRWEEVFGQVIAEAMACAKPLIGTRVGGIPELIEDGKTGYLVERGDTAAMADRLLALAADQALRDRMGRAGRQTAEARFDHRKNIAQLLQLYGLSVVR